MKDILEMTIEEMAGISFDCSCGKKHSFDIKKIVFGENVLKSITDIAEPFKEGKLLIVADSNTYEAAGKATQDILETAGYNVKKMVFNTGKDILIPDEKAIGRLFMELDKDVSLIVAVGSGTINDMSKYLSSRTKVPYVIVCTAPSMDGYASDGAPMICEGVKISYPATLPYGILADVSILKNAPQKLVHAGFGDAIGKYTALADWMLAKETIGEYYCPTCEKLVRKALDKILANIDGIKHQDSKSIASITEALILSGIAMGLIGVSRPASGAEHMLSHYWEMNFIAHNRYPELHGIKVGVATPVIARLFELMDDKLPESVRKIYPAHEDIEKLLADMGAPVFPRDIGIDRNLFVESFINGYKVRKRYSILQLAVDEGKISEYAEHIARQIYD